MNQPQVLGTIPCSTRGSTKEGGRNRTKEQSYQALADSPARRGGLSTKAAWTVRQGIADCPHPCRGPSKRQQNLQRRTANNGPSAGSTWTVRQAPADCPPGTRGPSETLPNQNLKPRRIENKDEQEHEKHATNTHGADHPPSPRGPSARRGQSRKLLDPEGQLFQSITGSPKRRSC
jgi:hypothetical protein